MERGICVAEVTSKPAFAGLRFDQVAVKHCVFVGVAGRSSVEDVVLIEPISRQKSASHSGLGEGRAAKFRRRAAGEHQRALENGAAARAAQSAFSAESVRTTAVKLAAKKQIDGAAEHDDAIHRREVLGGGGNRVSSGTVRKWPSGVNAHSDKHPRPAVAKRRPRSRKTSEAQHKAKGAQQQAYVRRRAENPMVLEKNIWAHECCSCRTQTCKTPRSFC